MSARRIISRHVVRRTAERELGRLWKLQEEDAAAELGALGITTATKLGVRHERKMFYKWAVVASA